MENPFELIFERLDRIEKAISELKEKLNYTPPIENDIMNIDEVSAYLKMCKPTIYGRVHRRTIPFYKSGKKLFFKKSDLENYFFSGKYLTEVEIKKSRRLFSF
ncbi:helix-turn-helix domain-containing protein [Flavobacterium gelidilacus]|uniref:helix-turn-helix domain-containing protein n=1 Tax=Flavobacterium gelidilacus TaxID=206041 RepID=UPI00040BE58A|nr:helix-turn-helix domain-containing protein [Flavobacterium gelidilacus]